MSDDLLQSVHKWLEKNGYPLEYDVQHAFDEAGFGSVQGFHIPDMKTDAVREIDVTASVMRKRENAPEIHCVHVVECKNNGNAWVAFTRPTSAGAKFCIEETIGNTLGRRGLVAWSDDKEVQALDLFRQRDASAFSGSEAFKDKAAKDGCYSALQSVVSASVALARSIGDEEQLALVFPVIVLGGKLLTVSYDMKKAASGDDTRLIVAEANEVRFHWRGAEALGGGHSTVDVVTVAHLPTWAARRKKDVDVLIGKLVVAS